MSAASDLAMLLERDLKRVGEEVAAFPSEDLLWATMPGITNSAGHLVLHLEGNLREFIGRQFGGLDYGRDRPQEFAGPALSQAVLAARVAWLAENLPHVIAALTPAQLDAEFPQDFMGKAVSARAMIIHIGSHLSWHLGQIDYLRRVLSASGAIPFSTL